MVKSKVIDIETIEQYEQLIDDSNTKLLVIKFSATWCGPCRRIHPQYENLSTQYSDIIFAHLDVDIKELKDLKVVNEVSSLPTFMFIKNGKKVSEFSGASIDKLKDILVKLTTVSNETNDESDEDDAFEDTN